MPLASRSAFEADPEDESKGIYRSKRDHGRWNLAWITRLTAAPFDKFRDRLSERLK